MKKAMSSKTKGVRQGSFGFLVNTLTRRLDVAMKERLSEAGVDTKQFVNLMMLAEQEGINQRELGEKLEFPEYSTSRTIDALVESGLAERRPDPNSRRSVLIYLTDQGRKKVSEFPPIIMQTNKDFLSDLSPDEQAQLIALLQKVVGPK